MSDLELYCKRCEWFALHDPEETKSPGECRRRAPVVGSDLAKRETALPIWPMVEQLDWCGDFEVQEGA